jgi:hypothetical protein
MGFREVVEEIFDYLLEETNSDFNPVFPSP